MKFAHPWLLLLLLGVPLLAWLKGRLGGQPAFLYSSVSLVRGISSVTQSHAGAILRRLRWLALILLIVGLARPQMGFGEQKVRSSATAKPKETGAPRKIILDSSKVPADETSRSTSVRTVSGGAPGLGRRR